MQRFRLVGAVLLAVVGAIWVGQGMGVLPGSYMSGDRFWAVAGIVAIAAGIFLAWDTLHRR